jgi:hypothetical protein
MPAVTHATPRAAYLDATRGLGASAWLGACCDAGADWKVIRSAWQALDLPIEAGCQSVAIDGEAVQYVWIESTADRAFSWKELAQQLQDVALAPVIEERAARVFQRWLEVAAELQGWPTAELPGRPFFMAQDVAAVLGILIGLEQLEIHPLWVSPVGIGATLQPDRIVSALLRGYRVWGTPGEAPLDVAALATLTLVGQSRPALPEIMLEGIGYGVADEAGGGRVTLWLAEAGDKEAQPDQGVQERTLYVVETNIDDMDPEFYDHVMARLFELGALDVFWWPMQMKKNRPAVLLRALCASENLDAIREGMLRETTSLGVRVQSVQRYALPRRFLKVDTPWGLVQIKVAELSDGLGRPVPEYEDCRRLAETAQVPIWQVYQVAQAQAWKRLSGSE